MTAPADSLDDFLAYSIEDDNTEAAITIEGDAQAAQIMRRYRAIQKRIAANLAVAEEETDRINAWEREVNAPLERQLRFFGSSLEGYMTLIRDRSNGKVKSISLPAGKITTTAKSEKWEVADKDAFTAWALNEGRTALYRTKHEPETVTTLKAHLTADEEGNAFLVATGEAVPGVKVTQPETPFTVSIKPN
ncbi:host nuclease inhibitor [Arthrobacter phage Ottawa]|nr:host nuclease inhibitor [Arthrobacter phage Kharcho]WIC89285.1 host nuclease inhibitor [Arthrobacter phage Ottawa]